MIKLLRFFDIFYNMFYRIDEMILILDVFFSLIDLLG